MLLVFYNGLALDHDEYEVSGTTLTLANIEPLISRLLSYKYVILTFLIFQARPQKVVGGGWVFQGSVSGYSSGGVPTPSNGNVIQKFPFSSDGNATDVGDLTQARYGAAGQSSSTSGYTSGRAAATNTIDKFPFATDGNANRRWRFDGGQV